MPYFFFIVFFVYSGMHAYAFLRARSAFGYGAPLSVFIVAFMALMVFAPFLIRMLEQREYEHLARAFAYLAYFWMAALFYFCLASALIDAGATLVRLGGWLTERDLLGFLPAPRMAFYLAFFSASGICAYGYFEARSIRLVRVRVETTKLPAGVDRLSVAQLSDMHLGLMIGKERLGKILELVRRERPDVLVSTGDLLDEQPNHVAELAAMLKDVTTTYGSFAVTGNHEYYGGVDNGLEFTRNAGFTVLRNSVVDIGPVILAGVDDRTAVQMKIAPAVSEHDLLTKLPRRRLVLFLKHQPIVDEATVGLFDLQISGHTHGGQIFPFNLLTRSLYPKYSGTYDLGKGSLLHVNRGTGTWGPPIRILATPEITLYELVRKKTVKSPGP